MIYKSFTQKYTDEQIKDMWGTRAFVSWNNLLYSSISGAINKNGNEEIVGIKIDQDGISCLIEKISTDGKK